MYSKYTTPSLSSSHRAHRHLHLIIVTLQWHSPCTLRRRRRDGGGHPGSHCRHPHCPPPCRPHSPCGAGWWWWGCRHCCAPRLACAPCHRSHPRCCLIIMPVPLLVVPLVVTLTLVAVSLSCPSPSLSLLCRHGVGHGRHVVVVVVSMQAGWWGRRPSSCCRCHAPCCCCRAPCCHCHAPCCRCCPPRLPLVVVVHDR